MTRSACVGLLRPISDLHTRLPMRRFATQPDLDRSLRMASTTPVLRVLTAILTLLVASLAPCAHANPQAKPEISFKVGEAERRAIVVNAPAAGEKRPAVIVLHGGMGSAEAMRASSGFDPVARENGFIAVYAEGTAFGTVEGRHAWNTGHLLRRQVRDADDIAYLDALIDRLIADHGADPARIFMTGGSNGGMMTFVYAVKRPERLAAVAPVVASMFSFDAVPKVPLPILIVNGAKDEEVPLAGGMSGNPLVRGGQATPFKPVREVVDFWVKANKSRSDGAARTEGTLTTTIYAAGEGGAVTEFVVDRAGGHGWPGSRARRDGNTPIMVFRGAERVWAFFEGKSRATPTTAAAAPMPGLTDTDWRCIELFDANGAPVDITGDPPTLRIAADGRASGFAGVNRYGCDARIGNAISARMPLSFGPVMATRMAGPPERMRLEQAFTAMLGTVRESDIEVGSGGSAALVLRTDRAVCARFAAGSAPAPDADRLRGFAHLAAGEWTTTLASGDILRETWRWEAGGRSLRVLEVGNSPDGNPWREEQVFFVDGNGGAVRVRGSNSYRNGAFEGTVTFGDGTAEATITLTQDGDSRRIVRRWRFDGSDAFEAELLEFLAGEGLVPLASWTYTRTREPRALPPSE